MLDGSGEREVESLAVRDETRPDIDVELQEVNRCAWSVHEQSRTGFVADRTTPKL